MVPTAFQRFYVKPNELQLESPYIQRNIALTQEAFNLRQITVKPFPADQDLTLQSLHANSETIDNIRLWDWQPLMRTYAQLQEIRTYYKFHNLCRSLRARRIIPAGHALGARARSRHCFRRTPRPGSISVCCSPGNGVVMSPVTRRCAEGLPVLYVQDIPPVAKGGPAVREPRIYFGQGVDTFVIVNGSTAEFDYPKGTDNVYATTTVPTGLRSAAWCGERSCVVFRRPEYLAQPIHHRINPHPVSSQHSKQGAPDRAVSASRPRSLLGYQRRAALLDAGCLYHEQLVSFCRPALANGTINYIRNSVKVVIDAYNGVIDFYLVDPSEPMAATYQRIFPSLFKPFAAMPVDLRKHIRYPEDLFRMQAQVYRAYHMEKPEVFYNREDLWQFPREPTSFDGTDAAEMSPYYIIMRLPGRSEPNSSCCSPWCQANART